ncbi:MAG TPA: oligosaccharide flippase family protein [Thermoleophilaceae bacterium]|nr:oligosaccharide flippase family protein [Thermoleophilaceae bacterium]
MSSLEPSAAARFDPALVPDLRRHTARGTVINGMFLIGANALGLVKGLVVASLLATSTYGVWGLLGVTLGTLLLLGSVGIDDKYIQQDDPDQKRAFEIAFTLQSLLAALFMVIIVVAIPIFSLIYDQPDMIAPGIALAAAMPALALQTPLWVHYRRMDFVKQRTLQVVDPVVSLVVTTVLALAGLEIWALVIGALAGAWSAAIAIVATSPYSLRFRWERGALAEYTSFSWPLFLAALSTVLVAQVPMAVTSRQLGAAAVGGIALALNVSQFASRVDDIVTQTLYPAICAVKDRADLLFESFWKSNRLALLWAAPCGTALALFAADFVHYVIGNKWKFAIPLLVAFGLTAVVNQVAFNWSAFFRARGQTRPIAAASLVYMAAVMAIAVPLLAVSGLTAFGVGMGLATVVFVLARVWFLAPIFPPRAVLGHAARGIAPTLPAAAAVLLLRLLESGNRTPLVAVAELAAFIAIVVAVTIVSERTLLRESLGYLRRRNVAAGTV